MKIRDGYKGKGTSESNSSSGLGGTGIVNKVVRSPDDQFPRWKEDWIGELRRKLTEIQCELSLTHDIVIAAEKFVQHYRPHNDEADELEQAVWAYRDFKAKG